MKQNKTKNGRHLNRTSQWLQRDKCITYKTTTENRGHSIKDILITRKQNHTTRANAERTYCNTKKVNYIRPWTTHITTTHVVLIKQIQKKTAFDMDKL